MDAPPVLTPERIDAMLSIMAEVCLEGVVESGQRQKAAEDVEAFERCGRTLQRACRNLRQTIAMKQRHDREQARKAEDARKLAAGVRAEAERSRREAVGGKRERVLRHFERVLWDEYEDDEAEGWLDAVEGHLTDLAQDPGFLETPVETLIQRLADDIGLGDEPEPPAEAESAEEAPAPSAISAVESEAAVPALAADPPTKPPEPPPDPPPEPYLAPWERLAPGQIMPGGTGW